MIDVLLLGTFPDTELEMKMMKAGVAPPPADNAQKYIIAGLQKNELIASITAVCSPRIKPYPSISIKKIDDGVYEESWGYLYIAGFINDRLRSFVAREKSIVGFAIKWAQEKAQSRHEKLIIIYSMHSPFLSANAEIKRIIPSARSCLIVPDVPELMTINNRNIARRLLKTIDKYRISQLRKAVDTYALYTRAMAEYFSIQPDKWILFEGLVDEKRLEAPPQDKGEGITALYAGSLNPKYGIKELIKAFSQLPAYYQLKIYGREVEGNTIKQLCEATKNCKYMGVVSPDAVFVEMQKSDLLVNPRSASLELTKYSFPSKTFEYLASGTPIVMNKLPGIPDEYDEYLFYFKSDDIDGMRESLNDLLGKGKVELKKYGDMARKFVKENKNAATQVEKVLHKCYPEVQKGYDHE